MKRPNPTVSLLVVFLFLAAFLASMPLSPRSVTASGLIPVTSLPLSPDDIPAFEHGMSAATAGAPAFPSLKQFAASVASPELGVAGVYVPEVMALRVVQQPVDNPAFVSSISDALTQFEPAAEFGAIGLLAHNNLAGAYFDSLKMGETLDLVYGDGTTRLFQVSKIRQVQALSPNSPYSDFIDLENGSQLSSSDLFLQAYTQKDTVVFQTCITRGGNRTWGRLFVTASPAARN